jgi:hypothetical protein
MSANYARLLADGVGAWLQYEQACGHIGLFSERYLAHPIGNILSGQTGNRVHAEYEHPVLAPLTPGAGRRPAIDFAVCEPYPTVRIAVESKWVGTTAPSFEDILWDLIRLELLVHESNAVGLFVLGGRRRELHKFFRQTSLYDASTDHKRKPLLRHDAGGNHTITIGPTDRARTPCLESIFDRYTSLAFPTKIRTARVAPFPLLQNTDGFQTYVWRIVPIEARATILGSEMKKTFPRPKASKAEVGAILAARPSSLRPSLSAASRRAAKRR